MQKILFLLLVGVLGVGQAHALTPTPSPTVTLTNTPTRTPTIAASSALSSSGTVESDEWCSCIGVNTVSCTNCLVSSWLYSTGPGN